ncbi:MAG: hypothetical protein ACO1O1_08625 [Adhaeribacter sp.]
MFKSFFAFLGAGLLALSLITACEPLEPKTRLDFVAGTTLTSGNRTLPGGEVITTSLFARSASPSNKLKQLQIFRTFDTLIKSPVLYLDTTFDSEEFGMTFVMGTRGFQNAKTRSKEFWTFTLIDQQGSKYEKQYMLTTNFSNTNPNLNAFSSAYFNRSARENIRYVAADSGLAFPAYSSQNQRLQAGMDFFFGEGPQLALTLSSLNGTQLRSTAMSVADFNAVANATHLQNQYNGAQAETQHLSVVPPNSVVAFKTGQGKIGLLQVGPFEIARDTLTKESILRRVPFNVKIQK